MQPVFSPLHQQQFKNKRCSGASLNLKVPSGPSVHNTNADNSECIASSPKSSLSQTQDNDNCTTDIIDSFPCTPSYPRSTLPPTACVITKALSSNELSRPLIHDIHHHHRHQLPSQCVSTYSIPILNNHSRSTVVAAADDDDDHIDRTSHELRQLCPDPATANQDGAYSITAFLRASVDRMLQNGGQAKTRPVFSGQKYSPQSLAPSFKLTSAEDKPFWTMSTPAIAISSQDVPCNLKCNGISGLISRMPHPPSMANSTSKSGIYHPVKQFTDSENRMMKFNCHTNESNNTNSLNTQSSTKPTIKDCASQRQFSSGKIPPYHVFQNGRGNGYTLGPTNTLATRNGSDDRIKSMLESLNINEWSSPSSSCNSPPQHEPSMTNSREQQTLEPSIDNHQASDDFKTHSTATISTDGHGSMMVVLGDPNEPRCACHQNNQHSIVSSEAHKVLYAMMNRRKYIEAKLHHIARTNPIKSNYDNHYKIGDFVRRGGFSEIFKGHCIRNGCEVILKFIPKQRTKNWLLVNNIKFPAEVLLHKACADVEGVIRFFDFFEEKECWVIVIEYLPNSVDLFDYMERMKHGRLTENGASDFFRQLVTINEQLLYRGIVHRDIKSENVLVDVDTNKLKLIDFGASALYTDTSYTDFHGTRQFRPPEYVRTYSYKAESSIVWTLGVLLYDMVMGRLPFDDESEILRNQVIFRRRASASLQQLIRSCLAANPLQRPTLVELSRHDWTRFGIGPLANCNHADCIEQMSWSMVVGSAQSPRNAECDERYTCLKKREQTSNCGVANNNSGISSTRGSGTDQDDRSASMRLSFANQQASPQTSTRLSNVH